MSFVPRLASVVCMWTLLTGAAEAAEFIHESFAGEFFHYLGLHLNVVMMTVWVFILGSCIGSFLNVVVYRMPAGMTLSHPRSHCPVCKTELTARDNIPILGWMLLRGRCRYCRVPISPRYPFIEFIVGVLFLTVLLVETNTGAANLPLQVPITTHGRIFESIFYQGHCELLGWLMAHVFYLTLTLAVCIIGFEGHAPPSRLIQTGVVAGVFAGIFWAELRPIHVLQPMPESLVRFWGFQWTVPQWFGGRTFFAGVSLVGILDGMAGTASGLATGWLAGNTVSRSRSLAMTVNSVFLLTGVFCGWQMTWPMLAIVLISVVVLKPCNVRIQRKLLPLILFGICSVVLLAWSWLLNGIVLIGSDGWQWTSTTARVDWVASISLLIAAALILSRTKVAETSDESGSSSL